MSSGPEIKLWLAWEPRLQLPLILPSSPTAVISLAHALSLISLIKSQSAQGPGLTKATFSLGWLPTPGPAGKALRGDFYAKALYSVSIGLPSTPPVVPLSALTAQGQDPRQREGAVPGHMGPLVLCSFRMNDRIQSWLPHL